MKIVDRILLVLDNCLLLLIFSVLPIARSERFYVNQFAKTIPQKTAFTEEELQKSPAYH